MARPSIWQPKFNRDAEFVVARKMILSGKELRPGDQFDKSLVNVRRHRQLFDQRKITQLPPGALGPKAFDKKPEVAPVPDTGDAAPLTIKHVGGGFWRVFCLDEPMTEPLKKPEAEAELERLAAVASPKAESEAA